MDLCARRRRQAPLRLPGHFGQLPSCKFPSCQWIFVPDDEDRLLCDFQVILGSCHPDGMIVMTCDLGSKVVRPKGHSADCGFIFCGVACEPATGITATDADGPECDWRSLWVLANDR